MTVKELYNLCANNHWEDNELVIVSNGDNIEDYVELTFSNVVTVSDFHNSKDGNLEPSTRVTLMI